MKFFKFIIISFVVFFLGTSIFFGLQLKETKDLEKELKARKERIEKHEQNVLKNKKLLEQVADFQKRIMTLDDATLKKGQKPILFVKKLVLVGDKLKLKNFECKINQMREGAEKSEENDFRLRMVDTLFLFHANPQQLMNFLIEIFEIRPFLFIKEMKIERDEHIVPMQKVTLQMIFYAQE